MNWLGMQDINLKAFIQPSLQNTNCDKIQFESLLETNIVHNLKKWLQIT